MANPELIEYAKNQLKAGSSINYIRTVLIKQGWGERDVDDALGIAQAEAGPAREEASAKMQETGPKAGKSRLPAIAGILTGLFFLVSAVFTILEEMPSLALVFNVTPWVTAIIELLAGIFWIVLVVRELI